MRRAALVCLLAALAGAGAGPGRLVPLLDLVPDFVKGGRLLRNRTTTRPGIFVGGQRYRGFNVPGAGRLGFHVEGAFEKIEVKVGVLDGEGEGEGGVSFRVLGDGIALASTPPLFAGNPPVPLSVAIRNVLLLELITEGGGRAAWVEGKLTAAPDRDLTRFLAQDAPFSPSAYPVAFRRRVNDAIDRGAAYLVSLQRSDGSWSDGFAQYVSGTTALNLLALLHAGRKPESPEIARGFGFLRGKPFQHTYSVACLLLALEAKYFPGGAEDKNAYIERPRLAKQRISEEDQIWIRDAATWLVQQQGAGFAPAQREFNPVWRYPQGGYDLSNTQYALFGLAAANRCGVATTKVWLPALRWLLGAQEKEGPAVDVYHYVRRGELIERRYEPAKARGFSYTLDRSAYGSMTSAGLCSLILCQQALYKNEAFQSGWQQRTRESIRDALAWLQEYFDMSENVFAGGAWWQYYLFNMERTGVLLDMRYIGTRDWYLEGAEELMSIQERHGVFGDPIGTAFAILFLKRATVPAMTSPLR